MSIPAPQCDSVFPFIDKDFRLTRRTRAVSLANKCRTDLLFNGANVCFRICALQLKYPWTAERPTNRYHFVFSSVKGTVNKSVFPLSSKMSTIPLDCQPHFELALFGIWTYIFFIRKRTSLRPIVTSSCI